MGPAPAPALSVVIPAYNRAEVVAHTLTSLTGQSLPPELYEIIVIDDGSTDRTPEVVSAWEEGGRVRLLRRSDNRGPGAARNDGIRRASGEIVVFVDSDVVVRPDFLSHHLEAHRQAGRAVVCRGPVVPVSEIPAPGAPLGRLPVAALSPSFFDPANASLPRSELLAAGLFDERFGTYGWEDFDLGFRLRRRGLARVFRRDAVAYHYQPPPSLQNFERMLAKEEERARAAVYLYRKYPRWSTRWLIQHTLFHRLVYFVLAAGGLINTRTAPALAARFRRSGRISLEYLALRAALNRHYLAALQRAWREGEGWQARGADAPSR
ncbi:MAG TPA: glycosyltransferase family 2 protein [bacterium]|nr:glycosyltransferase family 2 protein [bacterium]